jgi:DNA-binding transcriptional MerR regulator
MRDEWFTIGDLAKATDTKVVTIRYYERVGLLPTPSRTPGNYRSYRVEHLHRLGFIRRARDLGFSLSQVRALLGLADEGDRSCEAVDAIAREQLVDVRRKIADLTALRRELESIISQCGHETVADCRIIEALLPVAECPEIALDQPRAKVRPRQRLARA